MDIKLWLLFSIIFLLRTVNASVIRQNSVKQPWNLTEALSGTSGMRSFNGTWLSDQEIYYTLDKAIHKYNFATDADSILVAKEILELYDTATSFGLSPDFKKLLIRYDVEALFRHSYIAKYDVYDIEGRSAINIHNGEKLQYCGWSPVNDRLAYVYNNNAYIHYEDGIEVQLTGEGVTGIVYNGVPDWVYEEEVLSSGSAVWWSPDGNKVAVGFFNDTNVETFKYTLYGEADDPDYQYPKEVDLKYPKSGSPNPAVALRVFNLNNVEPTSVRISAPVGIVTDDHIMQNVAWTDNDNLLITWLNRRQNIGSMQLCTYEGVCNEVKRLETPEGWIMLSEPKCFNSGQNCLFTYWIDNWYQVWNLNLKTGENEWNSRGNFTVIRVYGYDENNDKLYYQATVPGDPSVYHVFSNDKCLSCDLVDEDGDLCRYASASFSTGYSYYAISCTGPNPTYVKIFDNSGNAEKKVWVSNSDFREKIRSKELPTIKFMNVTLADGSIGIAKLKLPPNLDESKKYPMIVYVYGGPNSVRVTNAFAVGFDAYLTTAREVIYCQIDGRGTGNKGKDLLYSVNNDLGVREVEDQIFVTKYLQDNLAYVDAERTGIWGWSYGGYMTAKTLSEDNNRVFQCGISVAPVTSWLYYDTIYTERYMGLPTIEDNLVKYLSSSVLNDFKNFETHDFMLIHGSGDDNVHYQMSLLLAKELQRHNILFEEQTYTDEAHSISNFLQHLYHTMDHFWVNCLNLEVDETE